MNGDSGDEIEYDSIAHMLVDRSHLSFTSVLVHQAERSSGIDLDNTDTYLHAIYCLSDRNIDQTVLKKAVKFHFFC
jgi:hypothetical protein